MQTAHIKVLLCFSLTHLFLCRVVLSYTTALFKLGMSHPPWAPTRLSGFSDVNMLCRQKISSFVCLGTGGVSDFFQYFSISYICLLPAEIFRVGRGASTRQKTTGAVFSSPEIYCSSAKNTVAIRLFVVDVVLP